MYLLIMQLSPASCYFLLLAPKYFLGHPILEHPQAVFFLWCWKMKLPAPTNEQAKLIVMYSVLFFYVRNGKIVDLQCGSRHSQVTVFVTLSIPGHSEGPLLALRLPSKKPSFARAWTITLSIVYSNSNQNRREWRRCKLLFRTVSMYILLRTESRTDCNNVIFRKRGIKE